MECLNEKEQKKRVIKLGKEMTNDFERFLPLNFASGIAGSRKIDAAKWQIRCWFIQFRYMPEYEK